MTEFTFFGELFLYKEEFLCGPRIVFTVSETENNQTCSVLQCDPVRTAAGIINCSYVRNTRLRFLLQTLNHTC